MSNQNLLLLNKPIGVTPLEMIRWLQKKFPKYKDLSLGYAGRLDPMAEGLLLILVGEKNKERKSIEKLPKKYTCEALFGIQTDTYDILGKITQQNLPVNLKKESIESHLPQVRGKHLQAYPPYSSPRVNGHPLFWWARAGRLQEIEIPKKEVEIYSIDLIDMQPVHLSVLKQTLLHRLELVTGEFRQEEIKAVWKECFEACGDQQIYLARFEVSCSSGTYIRSLIYELGKAVGCGALAYSIKRTSVGEFSLTDALSLSDLH